MLMFVEFIILCVLTYTCYERTLCQMALQYGHIAPIRSCMTYNVATESNLSSIQELLGIQKGRDKLLEPSQMIKLGIPAIAISRVKKLAGLSDQQMAQTVGISRRTLSRRIQESLVDTHKRLTPAESDRLYRLVQIIARAAEVFEDEQEAKRWLNEPKGFLQGQSPLEAIQTEPGVQQVDVLLGRIEHGIFA